VERIVEKPVKVSVILSKHPAETFASTMNAKMMKSVKGSAIMPVSTPIRHVIPAPASAVMNASMILVMNATTRVMTLAMIMKMIAEKLANRR